MICLAPTAAAEDPLALMPQVPRIGDIQTPEQFFGFAIGSRHLRHDQIVAYFEYLDAASDRIALQFYGQTHGARPLFSAAISAPDNIDQLDTIRKSRAKLSTGRKISDDQRRWLVMWIGYCVHGDEASAANAAPLIAYHLASAEDEATVQFLNQSVVMLDPALNPDGVDRFANWANENRGHYASPSGIDREHNQPWPGGRTNYYYFDLNRDWLPAVQPESAGRMRLYHAWKPNIVLDFHEMGGNSSFFFQPGEPKSVNPFSPPGNVQLTKQFATGHIAAMDKSAELFFSQENFDDFYIGKGSTYPDLQGAVGILFEQASTRGLTFANDRVSRHFRDSIANQVRLTFSSLQSAVENRQQILDLQTDFFASAMRSAEGFPIKGYLLTGEPSRIQSAIRLMRLHTIKVYEPTDDITWQGQRYASESVAVLPLNQPQHFLVRSLMEPKQLFERNVFYDVSTWHLPSAFDIHAIEVDADLPGQWLVNAESMRRQEPGVAPEPGPELESLVGWAIPPTALNVPRVVAKLQQWGVNLRVTTVAATQDEGSLPAGTFAVLKQPNAATWPKVQQQIQQLCTREAVPVYPIRSGSTRQGPDWGSNSMLNIPTCRPLLVMGSGTSAYSAGALWYFVDHRLRMPCDTVDVDRLDSVDLRDYTCVLLPEGSYGNLSKTAASELDDYVRRRGTVIGIGSAITALQRMKLVKSSAGSEASTAEDESNRTAIPFADAEDQAALQSIAGAFFQVAVDPTHPLAFGFPDNKIPVFKTGSRRHALPSNPHQLIAKYELVIAGYVSSQHRSVLKESAAAWASPSGSGFYILIADNPVFRGYVRGSERFLTNAMFMGPAFALPSGSSGEGESDESDEGHVD